MAEIREVSLSRIDPNPFRDGSGGQPPATWETVTEAYGFNEEKLKELQDSFRTNGVWAGINVREHGPRFQLAFGHHRVEAARRLGLKSIPVVVGSLSDSQMLQFMAAENSEEYGHDFMLGVINAVEAVVKAHLAGTINLPKPLKTRFVSSLMNDEKPFTPQTVGAFLGWVYPDPNNGPDGIRAQDKVHTALGALDLINQGALKRQALKGLGAYQARELVILTKRAMEAEEKKHERLQEALTERIKKAKKEGDKTTAAKVEEKLEEASEVAEKAKVAAGRHAASTVAQFHRDSESFSEASRKAAEALSLERKPAKPAASLPKKLDISSIDELIERLDRTLLEDDPRWRKVVELAQVKAAGRTFRLLDESLERLAERAKARAKELRKVRE